MSKITLVEPQKKNPNKLLFETEMGKLMERMYRLFSIRQRSGKEVRDYFKIKNQISKIKKGTEISLMVVDLVVEKLKQKGLLNDLEFARSWVEARRISKQKGVRALKAELFQKGIAREIIDEVLTDESSEEELAKQALEKKIKIWKNLPPLEFRKKAYEFLSRRGFDYEVVSKVLKN